MWPASVSTKFISLSLSLLLVVKRTIISEKDIWLRFACGYLKKKIFFVFKVLRVHPTIIINHANFLSQVYEEGVGIETCNSSDEMVYFENILGAIELKKK